MPLVISKLALQTVSPLVIADRLGVGYPRGVGEKQSGSSRASHPPRGPGFSRLQSGYPPQPQTRTSPPRRSGQLKHGREAKAPRPPALRYHEPT